MTSMIADAASKDGRFWAHSACALWMPDVDFAQPDCMSGLQLTRLAADRVDLECSVCRQVQVLHILGCSVYHLLYTYQNGEVLRHLMRLGNAQGLGVLLAIILLCACRRVEASSSVPLAYAIVDSMSCVRGRSAICSPFAIQTACPFRSAHCIQGSAMLGPGSSL